VDCSDSLGIHDRRLPLSLTSRSSCEAVNLTGRCAVSWAAKNENLDITEFERNNVQHIVLHVQHLKLL
jgi:hypothetical protein